MSDNKFTKEQVKHDHIALEVPIKEEFIEQRITGNFQLFFHHFIALCKKRLHYFKRDRRGFVCEIFLPIIMIALGFLASSQTGFTGWENLKLSLGLYNNENNLQVYLGGNLGGVNNYLQTYDNLEYIQSQSTSVADFNNELYQKKSDELKFGIFVTNNSPTNYQYTSLVNTVSINTNPISVNMVNNAIINQILGRKISITVNNQPLLLTYFTYGYQGSFKAIVIALIFSIGMAFIPASIITFIVREREEHIKHQQIVSGVGLGSYWFSNFFVDFMKYLVPALFSPFFAYIFNMTSLTQNGNFGYLYLIFFLYGFAMIPFVYLCSYLHTDYGNAQLTQFFWNFLVGGMGSVTFVILRFIQSTKDIAVQIHWILRIIPSFSYAYGIANLCSRQTYMQMDQLSSLPNQMDLNVAGGDVLFLIIEFFVYSLLLWLIESMRLRKTRLNKESNYKYIPQQVDEDVAAEKQKALNSNPKEYTVLVKNLRKVFIQNNGVPKVAVDDMNFTLKYGEVFCFLGTNGAGKTTTMRMLTGEENIVTGEAYIEGYKIPEQINEAQKHVGYCPQFDALLENLTAREHLELYAAIKGIPKQYINLAVNEKLDEMNLRKFENICAGKFSGGNKRKLSVAIAMLANPPIVFLDEPSTGMDPGNRRFMWDVISRIATLSKKSSIILTTHSMEEAEALGTKVGIVVGGNLQCFGSLQHLKNKFGDGFELDIKTKLPTQQDLLSISKGKRLSDLVSNNNLQQILSELNSIDFIHQIQSDGFAAQLSFELQRGESVQFSLLLEKLYLYRINQQLHQFFKLTFDNSYKLIEEFNNFCKIKVTSAKLSVGQLFGIMQSSQEKLSITSYMVNQTSLEQIFNDIAKKHEGGYNKPPDGNASSMSQQIQIRNINQNPFLKSTDLIELNHLKPHPENAEAVPIKN